MIEKATVTVSTSLACAKYVHWRVCIQSATNNKWKIRQFMCRYVESTKNTALMARTKRKMFWLQAKNTSEPSENMVHHETVCVRVFYSSGSEFTLKFGACTHVCSLILIAPLCFIMLWLSMFWMRLHYIPRTLHTHSHTLTYAQHNQASCFH